MRKHNIATPSSLYTQCNRIKDCSFNIQSNSALHYENKKHLMLKVLGKCHLIRLKKRTDREKRKIYHENDEKKEKIPCIGASQLSFLSLPIQWDLLLMGLRGALPT